jgi:hypothetical protein
MKKYLILILLFGLWATWALFGPRFIPTHDGEYHIIRFANFYNVLASGHLFPRWAPDLNSGHGVPLFNFHYPFPNYVGSLFHALGASFVDAVKLTLAAGYLVAAIACFFWLRQIFSARAAALGTLAGMLVPYWFVDIYVRGSVGEVWALSFLFAALAGIEKKSRPLVGLAVALLIVSHNILALLFVPFILIYLLVRWRVGIIAWILGILTASYFWMPALAERGYMQGFNATTFSDHFPQIVQLLFPSWGTGFSGPGFAPGEMSFQIGILPLLVFVVALWSARRQKSPQAQLVRMFAALLVVAVFFMLPISLPVWNSVGFIQYLQYPWRLLSFVIPVTALLAAYVAEKRHYRVALILVIIGFIATQSYTMPVTYERRDDAHYLTRKEFTDGTSSLGNSFTTIWTPWQSERPPARLEAVAGDAVVRMDSERPLEYRFHVTAGQQSAIRVHTLYYPGWTAYIDGVEGQIQWESDGLINLILAEGEHDVVVRFEETPLRQAADALSVVGLFCLLGSAILKRGYYAHRNRHAAPGNRPQRTRRGRLHKTSS